MNVNGRELPPITPDVSLRRTYIICQVHLNSEQQYATIHHYPFSPLFSIGWKHILRRLQNIMHSENVFYQRGITLLYRIFNLTIQSLLYGIYSSLIPVSTHIMMKKGLHSLSQKVMFGVTVFMFSLSTAYLAVSIAELIVLIKTWYLVVDLSESASTKSPMDGLLKLFNALVITNYALMDGIVVWRAWSISRDERRKLENRELLIAAIVMFVLSMLSTTATICVRAFIFFGRKNHLATTINVVQGIALISSLITNILGTGVISLKAWRYRRWIVSNIQHLVNKRTKAERVLALLVESGVFYIFSGATLVASTFIRLPGSHIMLGNVYSQASVHLAGIYTPIIVILVNREASMDKTMFNATIPIIITDLQEASSQLRANQIAAPQVKSTPIASLQFADAPRPSRDSLDPSSSQGSPTSSSSPESGVNSDVQSVQRGSIE